MANDPNAEPWSLEVVRGAGVGRRFALAGGTVVLGNALDGVPGIDLSPLEATSPRKMAGRQAQIHVVNGSLSLRDLGSPGGTFVDRRRVPPNSDLPLKVGDVIQLGGVQLRVARGAEVAVPARVEPMPAASSGFLFNLKSGAVCRSWDDILKVSAQKWADLRDELTSGRLSSFLATIGRSDVAPDPRAPGSPDDRLDAWIGRLPSITPAQPELEVHPLAVVIRAPAGGGVVRKKVQLSNVGYRLLKTRARVEPPSATWLTIAPDSARREVSTVEASDLVFDATVPDGLASPLSAEIVIEGNGGSARITVRVEPAGAKAAEPTTGPPPARPRLAVRSRLTTIPAMTRLVAFPLVAVAARLAIAGADSLRPDGPAVPGLAGPALAFAGAGAILAAWLASRGGEARDIPSAGLAGGILGAMAAALAVAICRAVESPISSSLWIALPAWGVVGAAIAGFSLLVAPHQPHREALP